MKLVSASLAVLGASALVLVGAAPAMAAGNSIDPGDSMYVINCDNSYPDFLLLSVESSTAAATPIGVGDGESDTCAGQPAYNPATGVSYYVRWIDDPTELGIIDVSTGISTVVDAFRTIDGEFPVTVSVNAIAIGANGSGYAIDDDALYSLDLATAELTEIGALSDSGLYAFAFDPVTGQFYAINYTNEVFEVDVTDGTLTSLGSMSLDIESSSYTYSLQFDEAGTAWIEVDNEFAGNAGLWSLSLSDLSATVYSGNFTDDPFYTEALLIIPGKAAALASTGADASIVPLLAGGALVLALSGAVLLIARRRTAE